MTSSILFLLLGLILVVVCSDLIVDGASDIARRSGISEFVIGLTIVGIGTSTPEMVVSFISAIRGNADMAVGNVVGSNIFNTFLILGVTAVILPMAIKPHTIRRDIPLNVLATLSLILLGSNISRIAGAVMLAVFIAYLLISFKFGRNEQEESPEPAAKTFSNAFIPTIMLVGGLAGLLFGGRMFVDSATQIAKALGWSDKFIAVTILAGGTSMPELATCIVAAAKKRGQLALGNIIGSNLANILLIIGGSALIHPLSTAGITKIDLGFMLASALAVFAAYFTFDKKKLGRIEGLVMLALEAIYMYLLIKEL